MPIACGTVATRSDRPIIIGKDMKCGVKKHNVAPDLLRDEESLEDLLAPSLGAHRDMAEREELFQSQPRGANGVILAEQAREVMGEQSLLEEVALLEVGEVADSEVDIPILQPFAQLIRWWCYGSYRRHGRLGLDTLEDTREENHLAHV